MPENNLEQQKMQAEIDKLVSQKLKISKEIEEIETSLNPKWYKSNTIKLIFGGMIAGLVFSFLVLEYVMPLKTIESQILTLKSEKLKLEAEITEFNNKIGFNRIQEDYNKLSFENKKLNDNLQLLVVKNKEIEDEYKKSKEVALSLKKDFESIQIKYKMLANKNTTNQVEKKKYEELFLSAKTEVDRLEDKISQINIARTNNEKIRKDTEEKIEYYGIDIVKLIDPSKGDRLAGKLNWHPYASKWTKQIVLYNNAQLPDKSHPVWEYVNNLVPPSRKGDYPWEAYQYKLFE